MRFSKKQSTVLTWWNNQSPWKDCHGIICDGAVRSGKTLCLSLGFVSWGMACFTGRQFALCGKTVGSLRRNLLVPLLTLLKERGFACRYKVSQNLLEVEGAGHRNTFYLFGGRDEGSAALIQGVTLAGILFDEVALMPRSFVEQGLVRCSVEGSRFWFSCNPESPHHWFYREWIENRREKNVCYLHFTMEDNPSLSPAVRERYRALYSGVFHQRCVLGRWTAARGLVYPMFSPLEHVFQKAPPCERYMISCDYGTVNPASFGLWGLHDGVWFRLREYYHDSRRAGEQKTDEEYAVALEALAGDLPVELVLVDPSAASFLQCLRRRGTFPVCPAKNSVAAGIGLVASALKERRILFHESCGDAIREFGLYRWNETGGGDIPVKEHDHAMDDIRYFCAHVFAACEEEVPFHALSVARQAG